MNFKWVVVHPSGRKIFGPTNFKGNAIMWRNATPGSTIVPVWSMR